jgi:hypothetical protein
MSQSIPQGRRTAKQLRRIRWERQRDEAIKREQIESCYKAHKTAQQVYVEAQK